MIATLAISINFASGLGIIGLAAFFALSFLIGFIVLKISRALREWNNLLVNKEKIVHQKTKKPIQDSEELIVTSHSPKVDPLMRRRAYNRLTK